MLGLVQSLAEQGRNLTVTAGAVARLAQIGVVAARYPKRHTVKVRLPNAGGFISGEVHAGTAKAGLDLEADLPDIGEQGLVIFPGGDFREGIWIRSVFSELNPPPTDDGNKWRKKFKDGTVIEHDRKTNTTSIQNVAPDGVISVISDHVGIGGRKTVRIQTPSFDLDPGEPDWEEEL